MKKLNNKFSDILYFGYRIVSPIFDPVEFIKGIYGYIWYFRDVLRFNFLSKNYKVKLDFNLYPMLHDKVKFTPFDAQYFFQQLWVFENIIKNKPSRHLDISSTYEMSGYISKITKAFFLDYRPIDAKVDNLTILEGDITCLKIEDEEFESISCLHVVEHIGLGRYGDPIDPDGYIKAISSLKRILKKGGKLYFSTPIGKNRLCFNAHRIFNASDIVNLFKPLKLVQFNYINDSGLLIKDSNPEDTRNQFYACGLFEFTK